MRVVHVTPYFAPAFRYGGPPRSILGLCRALVDAGVDVEVFTTNANGPDPLPAAPDGVEHEGVRVRYFPLAWPRRYWRAAGLDAALGGAIGSADLVHVHGLWNLTGWTGVRRARAAARPHVISPRGMLLPAAMARHPTTKSIAYWASQRSQLRSAAFLHATSPIEAHALAAFGPPVVEIANGVTAVAAAPGAIAALRDRARLADDDEVITFVGRLHPIKRIDLLAAAFVRVHQMRPRARLVLAGPDETGCRRQIEPILAAAADAVRWFGPIDGEEKWALLALSRAAVQCSDSESFGMSIAESLAAGTPVVVTDRSPWTSVESVGCGYAVAHDAGAIAAALLRLCEAPQEAAAMGQRGRIWARQTFGWPAIGRSMHAAYEEALAQPRRRVM